MKKKKPHQKLNIYSSLNFRLTRDYLYVCQPPYLIDIAVDVGSL